MEADNGCWYPRKWRQVDRSKVQGQWTGQWMIFRRSEERKMTWPVREAHAFRVGSLGLCLNDAGELGCCPVQGWLLLNHLHTRLPGHRQGHRDQSLLRDSLLSGDC